MDRNEQVLSLIGLCLRGRNLEVGEEPVEAVSRARDARVILLASDAAENTARRVQRFAETGQCVWLRVPFTKRELGQATGRGSAAVAAVTDIGLAVAVVRRLAELNPEKYDEDLAKLELKAKRAAERKSEAARHEKNLRRGVKRPKKTDKEAESSPEANADRRKATGRTPSGGQRTEKAADRRPGSARAGSGRRKSGEQADTPRPGNGGAQRRPLRKSGSRPSKSNRPKPRGKANPYAHSRPVKKGKGSFRKKEG